MKIFLNLIYILLLIINVILGISSVELNGAIYYMLISIIVSLLGLILLDAICTNETKQKHINIYNFICVISIILAIIDAIVFGLFMFKIPESIDKALIKFGLKEEVIIDNNVDIYTYDEYFKISFDTSTNIMTVYRNEENQIRSYSLSLYELSEQKQNDIRQNYHGKIDINQKNVIALYGIFNASDLEDSIAVPYIELNSGIYGIEGNQLIMDEIFTLLFNRNNIFKYKILTIQGLITTGNETKSGILEEYYTDKDYKYIYNGKRVYKDTFVCKNYSTITTPEKMKDYISYLGLEKTKSYENIIGKEIKIGGDTVNKIRLYYYNNLDSLNFIEIIFTEKNDSLIIKESDAKFKFENIQKLY